MKKKEHLFYILRLAVYSAGLIFIYSVMAGGRFFGLRFVPAFFVPFAVAAAFYEREFTSAVIGLLAGSLLDLACGHLIGSAAVWLMPACLAVSLLATHLMRQNLINHMWLTTMICTFMALMEYLFTYILWSVREPQFFLTNIVLPSYWSAAALSPLFFFAVRFVSARLRVKVEDIIEENGTDPAAEKE